MPKTIRELAAVDETYRTVWVHRWYWGNRKIDALALLLGRAVDDAELGEMVDEVDIAFLSSREVKSLTSKYRGLIQKRRESGIPLRFGDRERRE